MHQPCGLEPVWPRGSRSPTPGRTRSPASSIAFLDAGRAALEAEQQAAEQRAASTARQNQTSALGPRRSGSRARHGHCRGTPGRAVPARGRGGHGGRRGQAAGREQPSTSTTRISRCSPPWRRPRPNRARRPTAPCSPCSPVNLTVVHRIRTKERFLREAVSPDGRTVYLSENGPRIVAVDALTGRTHLGCDHRLSGGQVGSISVTPDGTGLLVALHRAPSPAVARLDARTGGAGLAAGPSTELTTLAPGSGPLRWASARCRGDGRVSSSRPSRTSSRWTRRRDSCSVPRLPLANAVHRTLPGLARRTGLPQPPDDPREGPDLRPDPRAGRIPRDARRRALGVS